MDAVFYHSLTPYTMIKSKWMKDLNVRQDSIKILEENTGNTLFELGHSNFLQDTSMKARETKAKKMNYWDLIMIQSFCTAKETVHKTKRQATKWERILANDISDKGLVSKIYKELIRGSLGGTAVWRLPLAQGTILETPDRIPHQAPSAWSLLLPLPMSLPLSLSACDYHKKKNFSHLKKNENK